MQQSHTYFFHRSILIFALVVMVFAPKMLFAQMVSVTGQGSSFEVGDVFQVTVSVDTSGKSINTVSGQVNVPAGLVASDIRSGNSIVTLWITSPKNNGGTISFAGGTPGGYSGSFGPVFSFTLRATSDGTFSISPSDIKLLLNDGEGTEVSNVEVRAKNVTVTKAEPKPQDPDEPVVKPSTPSQTPTKTPAATSTATTTLPNVVIQADTVPPESFMPLISRHPTVADNKYFASYFAVDKDSGIGYFEVLEAPLVLSWFNKTWHKADSPYVLKHQILPNTVYIRAYDNAGNMTESFAVKPPSNLFWILLILILIPLTVVATILFIRPRLRTKINN